MAKAKRKTLPKDFEALLKQGDITPLKAVFAICDVDARGGVFKRTALAFNDCPDELARWLVENGADLSTTDGYGETPLHARAGHRQGRIEVLLELGADIHARDRRGNTPLHRAAAVGNIRTVRMLIEHGAGVDCLNDSKLTPLAWALQQCGNTDITAVAAVGALLLDVHSQNETKARTFFARIFGRGAMRNGHITPDMRASIERIGTQFEFHRDGFSPDMLDETSAALDRLYELFDVPPVPRHVVHDGKSSIVARATGWERQHQELWELLVPSSGAASLVQGEVIRISGRIHNEREGQGGINWDHGFEQMADAFLIHVGSGSSLPSHNLLEAQRIVAEVKRRSGDTRRLCELAVDWVALNPVPAALPAPDYER